MHNSEAITRAIRVPKGLTGEALKIWKRLAPILAADGRLRFENRGGLESVCLSFALLIEAEREVDKLGDGVVYTCANGIKATHVWEKLRQERSKEARRGANEWGLTPASRARLDLSKHEYSEEDAAFEAL